MRYIVALYLTVVLACQTLAVPPCSIQRYDENDGLTQWRVTQMTQDRQGMMWFSTWNGLCRYDGYEFRGFKGHVGDGSSLAIDRFRSVWLADDGNLGCRVDEDMYLFNLKTYRFEAKSGLQSNHKNAKSVKPDRPYSYRDAGGNVWTVCYDGKLVVTEPNGKTTAYAPGEKMESARHCMPDRQGNLWVVAANCIYKLSFPRPKGILYRSSVSGETKTFFIDGDRCYWIATKGDKAVRIYTPDGNLKGWLTRDGHVSKTYTSFSSPIYCITQTHDGTIWMGSKPDGIFRLRRKTDKGGCAAYRVERFDVPVCNDVYDIKEDRWHRLWIATLGGGLCYMPNHGAEAPRIQTIANAYPKNVGKKTRMIYIAKDGTMLVATTDALVAAKLLPRGEERKMVFHAHVREPNRKDAISCSATMNIVADYRGRILVSTESGGINMITSRDLSASKLSFRHFGKDNGMPTDVALSVTPFGKNMLVVSSNSIVLFSPDTGWHETFNRNFFLSKCRFSEAVPIRVANGKWLFGLQDGIYEVAASELHKSNFVPHIALTSINVQGQDKDWPINASDTIVLASKERSLTLTFAALDYSAGAEMNYAFMLLKDNDTKQRTWNEIGHDHSVTLLDLAPGEYQLLIRSTNADGTWVDNVRRLTIVVTPTFWETTTAHVFIALFILLLLAGIGYTLLYIRRIKRQRHEALEAYLNLLNSDDKNKWNEAPLRPELSEENDALMRKVSAFVEEHIADADIGVGDMAEAAAVSRSGLQRKMKTIMGVTPLDFLKEARIKHACHLLSTTQMSISEVSYASGYTDPKYFSRSFKASTGKSPKEWRGEHAQ